VHDACFFLVYAAALVPLLTLLHSAVRRTGLAGRPLAIEQVRDRGRRVPLLLAQLVGPFVSTGS
jgi:hypothetical protein